MLYHRLLKITFGSLLFFAGLMLPACQSPDGGAEALTGRIGKSNAPRPPVQPPGFAIGADRLRPEGRH